MVAAGSRALLGSTHAQCVTVRCDDELLWLKKHHRAEYSILLCMCALQFKSFPQTDSFAARKEGVVNNSGYRASHALSHVPYTETPCPAKRNVQIQLKVHLCQRTTAHASAAAGTLVGWLRLPAPAATATSTGLVSILVATISTPTAATTTATTATTCSSSWPSKKITTTAAAAAAAAA